MKSILMLIIPLIIYSADLNITNKCKELIITKKEYKIHTDFDGKKIQGLQYGLKNNSNHDLKIEISIFPKDIKGNEIGEIHGDPSFLKAHYEYPFDNNIYIPIGENMTTFSGNSDLIIKCYKKNENTKNNNIGFNYHIDKKLFEEIKKSTDAKNELDVRMQIGLLIQLLIKEGGLNNIAKKIDKN